MFNVVKARTVCINLEMKAKIYTFSPLYEKLLLWFIKSLQTPEGSMTHTLMNLPVYHCVYLLPILCKCLQQNNTHQIDWL